MDDDITSGLLPDDITMIMVTLTLGHRQMVISGLRDDVMGQWITSGLPTDITIIMVTLAVQC